MIEKLLLLLLSALSLSALALDALDPQRLNKASRATFIKVK